MTDKNISIVSHLSQKDESKLLAKIASAERCPFHETTPEVIGPFRKLCWENGSAMSDSSLWLFFPDAYLFPTINWTCFCWECAEKNPTPKKHNKFGYGFCSQTSWQAAVGNWNKACLRSCKRMITDILKGSCSEENLPC